jgi:hypothetical protein
MPGIGRRVIELIIGAAIVVGIRMVVSISGDALARARRSVVRGK